jgi:hypothetical protein
MTRRYPAVARCPGRILFYAGDAVTHYAHPGATATLRPQIPNGGHRGSCSCATGSRVAKDQIAPSWPITPG